MADEYLLIIYEMQKRDAKKTAEVLDVVFNTVYNRLIKSGERKRRKLVQEGENPMRMGNRTLVIRKPISFHWKLFLGIASFFIFVGCYEILSYRQHLVNPNDTTIPDFKQMFEGLVKVSTKDVLGHIPLWDDFYATFQRLSYGLFVGVVLSAVLGVAMGCFTIVESFFLPILNFLTKVPPTAMLAVFFVLVGHDMKMFVTMIAFGVLPTLTQAIYQSAKYDVHEESIHKAYTLGASNMEVVLNVVYQQILPRIIESVRLQVGPALVFLIAAEWMVADVGFGYRLRIQSRLLNMSIVYDYIILLGILGFILDRLLTRIRIKLCPWFDNNK